MTKRFSFNTNTTLPYTADGGSWAAVLGAASSLAQTIDAALESANDPVSGGGALKARRTARNKSDGAPYWEWTGTYEDLGLPAGTVITSITVDYDYRCSEYSTGASSLVGPAELRDNGGTLRGTFSTSVAITGTNANFTARAGTAVSGLTDPSNTTIKIRIADNPKTGNNNAAAVSISIDNVLVTVVYAYVKTGMAISPAGASGASAVIYDKSGLAVSEAKASGPKEWIPDGTTYTKAGLAVMGVLATIYTKTGLAISSATADSASAVTYAKEGLAASPATAVSSSSVTYDKGGLAVSEAKASGTQLTGTEYLKTGLAVMGAIGATTYTKSGLATAVATSDSDSEVTYVKAGFASAVGVASGSSSVVRSKAGIAVATATATSSSSVTYDKSGLAAAPAAASGTQTTTSAGTTYTKAGLAVMGEIGSYTKTGLASATATAVSTSQVIYDKVAGELGGPYVWMEEDSTPQAAGSASGSQVTTGASTYTKAGLAVASAVASGTSVTTTVYEKTGSAISTATASGARQRVYTRGSTAAAVALAFGSRTATFTRAGLAISAASASGSATAGLSVTPAETATGTLAVHPGCGPLDLAVDASLSSTFPGSSTYPSSTLYPGGNISPGMSPANEDALSLSALADDTLVMTPY